VVASLRPERRWCHTPPDDAVDEQDRVVAGLARGGEGAGGGRARVQPFPGLARDDVGVEVGQQADPAVRTGWRRGVADEGPGRLAVHLDLPTPRPSPCPPSPSRATPTARRT
jgi:hypothetical protein